MHWRVWHASALKAILVYVILVTDVMDANAHSGQPRSQHTTDFVDI